MNIFNTSDNIATLISNLSQETLQANPFYQKNVVLTGTIENVPRALIETTLKQLGANISKTVNKDIHFLISGQQDIYKVGPHNVSSKEKKAAELIEKGIVIQMINGDEFISMINKIF